MAREFRKRFHDAETYLVSRVPSLGSGWTAFLERTLTLLGSHSDWDLGQLDFLFIENVGNLVCPASHDAEKDLRAVPLSVTEGEDKPLKYPTIFSTADVAVLTKMDLAEAVKFDSAGAEKNVQRVRPGSHGRCLQLLASPLTPRESMEHVNQLND